PFRRVRAHHHVAAVVDAEVALAPRLDVVELEGVLDPPGLCGIELANAVDGALGIGGHGALYQNCVTRKSARVRKFPHPAPPGAPDRGSTRSTTPRRAARRGAPRLRARADCGRLCRRRRTPRSASLPGARAACPPTRA